MFEVPTFEEAIQLIQGLNKSTGKNIEFIRIQATQLARKRKTRGGENPSRYTSEIWVYRKNPEFLSSVLNQKLFKNAL